MTELDDVSVKELLEQMAWDVRVSTHALCALTGAVMGIVIGGWIVWTYFL